MKTKQLTIAVMATLLLILSGCKKDENPNYDWAGQFKKIDNFIGKDSTTIAQQILNEGYAYTATKDGEATFVKAENNVTYAFGITCTNTKVSTARFAVQSLSAPATITATDAFVTLVRTLGASYTSSHTTIYPFTKCSYVNTSGMFQETDYSKLDPQLAEIANYSPYVMWKTGTSEIDIVRSTETELGFLMYITITDENVK